MIATARLKVTGRFFVPIWIGRNAGHLAAFVLNGGLPLFLPPPPAFQLLNSLDQGA